MKSRTGKFLIGLFIVVPFIIGCAKTQVATQKPPLFKNYFLQTGQKFEEEKKKQTQKEKKATKEKPVVKLIEVPNPVEKELVTVRFEKKPKKIKSYKIKLPEGRIQISVENMPLYEFINLVFGKLLSVNYFISPDVANITQKITLSMTEPMDPEDFLYFVTNLLEDYRVSVSYEKGIFKIRRVISVARKQTGLPLNVYIGRELPELPDDADITFVVPTYYVPANKLMGTLTLFVRGSKDVSVNIVRHTSALIVSGKFGKVKKIVGLIKTFDKPYFADKHIYFLKLDYVSVEDFVKSIKDIFENMGIKVMESQTDTGISLIPIESINAIVAVSPKKEWIDSLLYWKEKLDIIESLTEERHMFVYKPKHRSAEELASVLSSIEVPQEEKTKKTEKKEEKKPEKLKELEKQVRSISGKYSIVVDKARNTLIVHAYPSDYKKIKTVLEQIDTPPKQVLIEVTIAEITLKDELKYGLEWYIRHKGSKFIGDIQTLGGLGVGGAGLVYSLVSTGGRFKAIMNAFAKKDLINIISTPHIVVLDGNEASINVGTEVPVVSSEVTSPDLAAGQQQPSILRNVQYRSTGVILSVTPTVLSEDYLTIKINQELSEAQSNTVSKIDSPIIINRSINTKISLRSGDTVILGGLISTNNSTGENKVPLLGDIPVLGNLFRVQSRGQSKTELIIQITPYILKSSDDLDAISKKFIEASNLLK